MSEDWRQAFDRDYRRRLRGEGTDIQAHLPALHAFARRYTGAVVGELGTRTGESTSAFLAAASIMGGHVWSIDHEPPIVPPWWSLTGFWSFLQADDVSDEAASFLPAELDVLFIDTDHRYDHTVAELERYVPRLRPGGVAVLHDTETTCETLTYYTGEDYSGPKLPVATALNHVCTQAGLVWTCIPGSFGLGVIEIP